MCGGWNLAIARDNLTYLGISTNDIDKAKKIMDSVCPSERQFILGQREYYLRSEKLMLSFQTDETYQR